MSDGTSRAPYKFLFLIEIQPSQPTIIGEWPMNRADDLIIIIIIIMSIYSANYVKNSNKQVVQRIIRFNKNG